MIKSERKLEIGLGDRFVINKHISEALDENYATVFIERLESNRNIDSKFQYAKTKWDGDE